MTGGFLRVPTMRSKHCWTVLLASTLAVLVLTSVTKGEDSGCDISINVRRGTVYDAVLGRDFRINCTVSFCNETQPVSWYKVEKNINLVSVNYSSHIKTEWKELDHLEGTSYLIFQNILSSNAGLYRCKSGGSVSHNINVSVNGEAEFTTVTWMNDTKSLWMYVYPAAGIVAIVIIVIVISVISMRGCKGKSKKEAEAENQYMAIPMGEPPHPHASLEPSPRESPSVPPSRRSTQREAPPSQPSDLTSPRGNEDVYSKIHQDRERQRNVEEGSSVVYAALNHHLPQGAAARPRRPEEEFSEYAAIRVP
ncbi:uncharacterized protein LOC121178188 isoform X2 [Toxotes jaculatrix]|uniref:uncharacterized protein LOC121178188 isoform X2 n=1 Tax=Toxotes jaculatrix TaxID=941984 RepID=UPI001B3AD0C5|nr:uncharacterized protein LOC121178188 isoform X2 [Toxotes jaculatrix]